jgi:hypothetical protein
LTNALGPTRVADSAESTTSTLAPEEGFVNGVAGPVLGADVHGGLVLLGAATMRRVDLFTGAVEEIDLDRVLHGDPEDRSQHLVIGGGLVSLLEPFGCSSTQLCARPAALVITDLRTGSQSQVLIEPAIVDEAHIAGAAGPDSVWLATYPGPDGSSAIEVGLNGEVRRRIELPPEFSVRWARSDELFLDSVDGSWRYDASTGEATRLAGELVSDRSPLLITVSCESNLDCRVEVDVGDGPTAVDGLRASEVTNGSMFVAPDLTAILAHNYETNDFTYFDLSSGTRVELGEIDIDPYAGVVWVPDSPWIIGLAGPRVGGLVSLTAVNVQTAEQLELVTPYRSIAGTIFVAAPPA